MSNSKEGHSKGAIAVFIALVVASFFFSACAASTPPAAPVAKPIPTATHAVLVTPKPPKVTTPTPTATPTPVPASVPTTAQSVPVAPEQTQAYTAPPAPARTSQWTPQPVAPLMAKTAIQMYAKQLVGDSTQYSCLAHIIERESGWNPHAGNSDGSYGVPQSLPGDKMSSEGADWRDNPKTQLRWMVKYIHSRYGTPCGAWAFWQEHSWY